MTFYEQDFPRAATSGGLLSRITTKIGNGIRVMQYGRMMQVLSEMSDTQLETLGIARSDISRHAHECVYGTEF